MIPRGHRISSAHILDHLGDEARHFVGLIREVRTSRIGQHLGSVGERCALLLDQQKRLFQRGPRIGSGYVSRKPRLADGVRR